MYLLGVSEHYNLTVNNKLLRREHASLLLYWDTFRKDLLKKYMLTLNTAEGGKDGFDNFVKTCVETIKTDKFLKDMYKDVAKKNLLHRLNFMFYKRANFFKKTKELILIGNHYENVLDFPFKFFETLDKDVLLLNVGKTDEAYLSFRERYLEFLMSLRHWYDGIGGKESIVLDRGLKKGLREKYDLDKMVVEAKARKRKLELTDTWIRDFERRVQSVKNSWQEEEGWETIGFFNTLFSDYFHSELIRWPKDSWKNIIFLDKELASYYVPGAYFVKRIIYCNDRLLLIFIEYLIEILRLFFQEIIQFLIFLMRCLILRFFDIDIFIVL